MNQDVYRKLAQHLNKLPNGFPATEQGIELKILSQLFTPDEAELAIYLTLKLETAEIIAKRVNQPIKKIASKLENMSRKGLIFSIESQNRPSVYMAAQFVPGIWEYHVNKLTPQFVHDIEIYMPKLAELAFGISPPLRTIPIGRSLPATAEVLPYELAEELIRCQQTILVAPCICRREKQIKGEGCGKLIEACLVFGWGAEYYHRNQLGRIISQDEAITILHHAEKEGLVLQPSNTQHIVYMCLCCGDCCQVLLHFKRLPIPALAVVSPFTINFNQEACIGCGLCTERCQMEAIRFENNKAIFIHNRCIGCGLCVTTCAGEALSLERKIEQSKVPKDTNEAVIIKTKARSELKN